MTIHKHLLVLSVLLSVCIFNSSALFSGEEKQPNGSENLLLNTGFEQAWEAWSHHNNQDAQVSWDFSSACKHTGVQSLHISNASGYKAGSYGTVEQTVKTIPLTRYRFSVWVKADDIRHVWFGGGKDWRVRHNIPDGVYDWQEISFYYTTREEEYSFTFRINVDGPCKNLWIDDVAMMAAGAGASVKNYKLDDLGELDTLPVLPAVMPPVLDGKLDEWTQVAGANLPANPGQVEIKDWRGKDDLSYRVKATWDQDYFYLALAITDDVHVASVGAGMWQHDSIQLAFSDQQGEIYGPEYGLSASTNEGSVHCWNPGKALSPGEGVKLKTLRQGNTTIYESAFPWKSIFSQRPEKEFRFNVIVNDDDGTKRRGWIGWRPGLGDSKNPHSFVRCRLIAHDEGPIVTLQPERAEVMKGDQTQCNLLIQNSSSTSMEATAQLTGGAQPLTIPPFSITQLRFPCTAIEPGAQELNAQVRFTATGQEVVAKCSLNVLAYDKEDICRSFDQLEKDLPSLEELFRECAAKGISTEYERVNDTVLHNFIGYGRQDLQWQCVERAGYVNEELKRLYHQTQEALQSYLDGKKNPLPVMRYCSGKLDIRDYGFSAKMKDRVSGATEERPVFLWGYGHFQQVRDDIPQMINFGANIIQVEIGPRNVVLAPRKDSEDYSISTKAIEKNIIATLTEAEKHNVLVNVLISPHYFPDWALKKWPEIRQKNGFLPMSIDAPRTRMVLEAYLRTLVPLIKGFKSLHSICLSNEPVYPVIEDDEFGLAKWTRFLQNKYQNIAALNQVYHASFKSFNEVPPAKVGQIEQTPLYCDFALFNMDRFGEWHRWMADIIHQISPEIPVHAKIMNRIFNHSDILDGVDPERIDALGQINGCDNWCYYTGEIYPYMKELMFYDLQCSLQKSPIFNSEDHIIPDRDNRYIPQMKEHLRTVIWQGALHGRSASTMWIWARTKDVKASAYGGILYRPDCVAVAGQTNLDMNRLSRELKALQDTPYTVRLLYAVPSIVYSPMYGEAMKAAYQALSLSGCKIGYISEEMLKTGGLEDTRLIIVPNATHVTSSTLQALHSYASTGGKILLLGDESLSYTPENFPQNQTVLQDLRSRSQIVPISTRAADVLSSVAPFLDSLKLRTIALTTQDGKAPEGVEWRSAPWNKKTLLNLVNYTLESKTVKISMDGTIIHQFHDLLNDKDIPVDTILLKPLEPVLLNF